MNLETFTNLNLQPIITNEMFTLYDPAPDLRVNRKVFSFSLFMKENTRPEDIPVWRRRYPTYQMNFMRELMADPMWNDYGFIHFFHIEAFREIYQARAAGEPDSQAIIDSIIALSNTLTPDGRTRFKLYFYTHPNKIPVFWGTVLRFLPLIMPDVDVVLFRDAHSSTPNYRCNMRFTTREVSREVAEPMSIPCNSLDRTWVELWEAELTKKYMFYTMKGYQPVHALGDRRPLAGAWGAKKINGEQYILNYDEFRTRLCNLDLAMSAFGNYGEYGVDEQLLYYFLTTEGVQQASVFIGITWLLYLFYPQTKIEKLTKKKLLTKKTNGSRGETVEYCMEANNLLPSNNYNNSARCIIFSSIESFGHTVRQEMSPQLPAWNGSISTLLVKEVIECMGRARNYANNYIGPAGPQATMYYNMSLLIPDARNLWDTLFTTQVNLNMTILDYLTELFGIKDTARQIDNMCRSEIESVSIMQQFGGTNKNKVSKKPKQTQKKTQKK